MRVSAKAEYACVAMIELAANRDSTQPIRVKTIADAHGIPLRFLVQILLQLKGAGLVASTRGAAGGYHLTRPAETISVADIINVIDRALPIRTSNSQPTPSLAFSTLRGIWRDAQVAQQQMLEQITLADLVRQTQESSALSYQI
jgi:Rrf2 family transcriptional regulator, cysteine metabolism repressor